MDRKDIKEQLKWDLSAFYESDEAWEKAYDELKKTYEEYDYSPFQGKLGDKAVLLNFFALEDKLFCEIERLYVYASMRRDEDVRISKYNSYIAKMSALYSKIMASMAFVEPELTALSDEQLNALIADKDFADYDYRLSRIAQAKAHVLSEAEEKILALASDVMGGYQSTFSMLDNANLNLPKNTLNGEEVQMSHGLYGFVLHSENRAERESWFKKYYEAYIKLIDAITQTYSGNVKKDIFYKTVRKYDSCLKKALEGEDVSEQVYNNLIESIGSALPVVHRYISLRKKILGYETQHMYDIYAPLVEDSEIKLGFEEAYELVVEGLAPLGKEYQELLRTGKRDRWIDVHENDGKRSGAYSIGAYGVHPYVLLNYQETTNDIFTVAHEMGHAIHTYQS